MNKFEQISNESSIIHCSFFIIHSSAVKIDCFPPFDAKGDSRYNLLSFLDVFERPATRGPDGGSL